MKVNTCGKHDTCNKNTFLFHFCPSDFLYFDGNITGSLLTLSGVTKAIFNLGKGIEFRTNKLKPILTRPKLRVETNNKRNSDRFTCPSF